MSLLTVRLAVWALVAFHALLFARRIGDATISDPVVALRWLGAAVLLITGWLHTRRGGSLVAGRGALAFWLAVFLLHAFALTPATLPVVEGPTPLWSLGLLAGVMLLLIGGMTAASDPPCATRSEAQTLLSTLDRIARLWARPPPISLSA